MQIFAKRTKKKAASSAPRTVNKSDPIVEELLKKDPSEWNAKERRMVKRYRERKATEPKDSTSETQKTVEAEETEEPKLDAEKGGNDEETAQDKEDSDSDNSSSSSSGEESESDNDEEKENNDDADSSSDSQEDSAEAKAQQSTLENAEKTETPDAAADDQDDGKVAKDHEIWSVLDKLNSKQKRTLSRKLDRLGKAALEEVEQEANKILDLTMPIAPAETVKRDLPDAPAAATEEPKKKKRKKAVDWSSLTPEERLRREDQRKKQQEAAERRARGEAIIKPGHNRPLNSARRRANRRKPKWERKAPSDRPDISDYKQEHHSSGFLHRKNRKNRVQQEQY